MLLGYSQGAHIVGDALGGGGGGDLGAKTEPVPANVGEYVAAVIQMGDPRHLVGQPFDVGSSTRDGIFPRLEDQSLTRYAGRIQSYCDSGDPYCDRGDVSAVHLGYTKEYNGVALGFVLGKIGG